MAIRIGTKNQGTSRVKVLVLVLSMLFVSLSVPAQPKHTFGWKGTSFLLDGKPFTIRSGEIHYPRVPRTYWRDRFKKARAMGLNTITTYVFWNLHEPKPGKFDFKGNLDVAEFVREAGEEGLYVIVRPGPYICTEWDFGGFPAWLFKNPDIKVRGTDPVFLAASAKYMQQVGKQLAPLQITKGGNIIMAQVENEYGSFAANHAYMSAVRDQITAAGFDVTLFTSDGPGAKNLDGGSLPNDLAVINFGAGDNVGDQFKEFDRRWPDRPRMVGEYWVGWFDHWGETHHPLPPWGGNEKRVQHEVPAEGIEWMLSNNTSFNVYMFHGGTTWGFMAGANSSRDMPIQPDTSSYDYGSPLDEAGRPNDKFFALRDVIQKHFPNERFPTLPPAQPMVEIPAFELKEYASLDGLLKKPVKADEPPTMESLDQSYGFLLYRKKIDFAAKGKLSFGEIRDYAVVSQGDKRFGALDRRLKQNSLDVDLVAGKPLDVFVENMGRINFGPHLIDDRKGIMGKVKLSEQELNGWDVFRLPMTDLSSLRFAKQLSPTTIFYRGSFNLASVGDTFLDMSPWEKGHVWVNGHHLGRFWRIGPQQTLFVPAVWLKKGKNEIVVLDVGKPSNRIIKGVINPIFGNK
ncbi:MAG: beta-galactosidase family protein [Pyrinomonadaceae bacterium]